MPAIAMVAITAGGGGFIGLVLRAALQRSVPLRSKLVDRPWTIMSIGLRDWAYRF